MKVLKSALIGSSLLIALTLSFTSHGAHSDVGANSWGQIESELVNQQDWIIENISADFGVEVQTKSYSARTMQQLRTLHKALKNNEPITLQQLDQIVVDCRRGPCR